MANTANEEQRLKCLRIASDAASESIRIYNLIRDVGHGELTADNALHRMIESYHELNELANDIHDISEYIASIEPMLKKGTK